MALSLRSLRRVLAGGYLMAVPVYMAAFSAGAAYGACGPGVRHPR
jgi:hypothetical protein